MKNGVHNRKPQVVIIGGGFAGVEAARTLADTNLVSVTLISNKSYLEYYPAFYRVVTGSAPIEVCVPLADMVPKNVDILVDRITSISLEEKKLTGESGSIYEADYIILAMGSETTFFNLPGLAELSFGFKSVKEALRLKNHIEGLFKEHAHPDIGEMVSHFHVVIVGGGPSGVEVAGDLTRYLERLSVKYKTDPSFITIDIFERNNRVLPSVHPRASEKAEQRLRKLGVNIFLNRTLLSEEIEQVYLKDMTLKSKTVIWTAGTMINPLFSGTKGLTIGDRRRVVVGDYLDVPNFPDFYVAGDGAQTKYSGLAQTAIYDGNFVAQDIIRKVQKVSRKKYVAKMGEYVIPIGRHWALMTLGPFRLYGFFAYLARHLIDFLYFGMRLKPKKFFSLFFEGYKYR